MVSILKLVDIQSHPYTYKLQNLETLLRHSKYTMKDSHRKGVVNNDNTLSSTPLPKRMKYDDATTI